MEKSIENWNRFLEGFLWIFGRKMSPNQRNIDGKIDRKIDASWSRFLEGFSLILNPNRRKIDRKNDASWNRFLEGFWWIFGPKMEACWHQNRTKIDANFEERFFEKTSISLRKNNDFEGSGDRSWR